MLNRRGSTLIESLLAFEIFICVLVLYVSLFNTVYRQEKKLIDDYKIIDVKESTLSNQDVFSDIIEMVLH